MLDKPTFAVLGALAFAGVGPFVPLPEPELDEAALLRDRIVAFLQHSPSRGAQEAALFLDRHPEVVLRVALLDPRSTAAFLPVTSEIQLSSALLGEGESAKLLSPAFLHEAVHAVTRHEIGIPEPVLEDELLAMAELARLIDEDERLPRLFRPELACRDALTPGCVMVAPWYDEYYARYAPVYRAYLQGPEALRAYVAWLYADLPSVFEPDEPARLAESALHEARKARREARDGTAEKMAQARRVAEQHEKRLAFWTDDAKLEQVRRYYGDRLYRALPREAFRVPAAF